MVWDLGPFLTVVYGHREIDGRCSHCSFPLPLAGINCGAKEWGAGGDQGKEQC